MEKLEQKIKSDKTLVGFCFVTSIIGWLIILVAIVIYHLDYGTNEFSFMAQVGATIQILIPAGIFHSIASVLVIIHVIRVSFLKIKFEQKAYAGIASLVPTSLFLYWFFLCYMHRGG